MNKGYNNYLKSIAAWLDTDPEEISLFFNNKIDMESDKFIDSLRFSFPAKFRLIRKYVGPIINMFPYSLYRLLTDFVKKARGSSGTKKNVCFTPDIISSMLMEFQNHIGKRNEYLTIALTHDIDTAIGYKFCKELADIDQEYGNFSTFNVLTKGPYKLEHKWLDDIESRGFEIGIHGDNHDLGFGFRKEKSIRKRLQNCLSDVGRPVVGYRAPGACFSETLMHVLDELGFRYDSSILNRCYYANGIASCIPYMYPNTTIWELPLTIQDDGLFRDRRLNDNEALVIIKDIVNELLPFSGFLVINTHPSIIKQHISFYKKLNIYLKNENKIIVTLPKKLANNLDTRVSFFNSFIANK